MDPSPIIGQDIINILKASEVDNEHDGQLQKTLSLSRFSNISQELFSNSDSQNNNNNNNNNLTP